MGGHCGLESMLLNRGEEDHLTLAEVLALFYPLAGIFFAVYQELNNIVAFLLVPVTIYN